MTTPMAVLARPDRRTASRPPATRNGASGGAA